MSSFVRNRLLFAAFFAFTLGVACSDSSKCPAGWTNGIAPLHTEGRFLKDPAGNVVILRGAAIVDPVDLDNRGGNMNTDRLLMLLTDASQGFYARVVRITVFPKIWKIYGPEVYFNQYLEPAVRQATALGLYAIIDWHEIDDVEHVADETAAFWKFMAPKLADHSNVLYEVFNEPEDFSNTWAHWKQYAQPWVDQIRRDAPDRIILIGGPSWCREIGGAASDPFVGDNLAYVGHIYPPSAALLLDEAGPIARAANVRPVFITEWGFSSKNDPGASQTTFGEPLKAFIEAHGLSWTAWCASGIWTEMMFSEDWRLLEGEAEMGGFTKDWLAQRKDQDQAEKAAPGQCPVIAPSNRPPAPGQDASTNAPADASVVDAAPVTPPDRPVADTLLCTPTAADAGSESCPTAPLLAEGTPCQDVGQECNYLGCANLAGCACRDDTGTGTASWQCFFYIH